MNSTKSTQPSVNAKQQAPVVLKQPQAGKIKPPEKKPLTFGQKVADKMAAKVGSWAFLIRQSTVLAGWVGMNLMPGVPHWDESPFILLNLVFSFASAYTAPIVLMSQNRQSDVDRENAAFDHQVNLKAGQNIELLHEKIDSLQAQQIKELTLIFKEQQWCLNEIKASVVPPIKEQPRYLNKVKASVVPPIKEQPRQLNQIKVTDSKFPNGYSVYIPFKLYQPIGDKNKVIK